MAKKRAGWERLLYVDLPGATATTAVETATDVDLGMPHEFNEHTTRGDGSAIPLKTEQIVCRAATPAWKFIFKDGDAAQALILAAVRGATALAVKIVSHSGGTTEFDGDCYLEADSPGPLKGGQEVTITGHPTDDGGRAWTIS